MEETNLHRRIIEMACKFATKGANAVNVRMYTGCSKKGGTERICIYKEPTTHHAREDVDHEEAHLRLQIERHPTYRGVTTKSGESQ